MIKRRANWEPSASKRLWITSWSSEMILECLDAPFSGLFVQGKPGYSYVSDKMHL